MIVPLSRGKSARIDDDDAHLVVEYRWWAKPSRSRFGLFYAYTQICGKTIYMHRHIIDAAAGSLVDHINSDGLDNRRQNLRLTDHSGNNVNKRGRIPTSGFRGVYPRGRKFQAQIGHRGKNLKLGVFTNPQDAARAYDQAAREIFGSMAVLNLPRGL